MHFTLRARGAVSGVPLFELSVDGDGNWHYRSRAVRCARPALEPDRAQLKARYEQVDWDVEVLHAPIGRDAHTLFELEVTGPRAGPAFTSSTTVFTTGPGSSATWSTSSGTTWPPAGSRSAGGGCCATATGW